MRIITIDPKPRYTILLTYAQVCRTLKCTTSKVDEKIKEYAKREGISVITAFQEFTDIAMDLEAARYLRQEAEIDPYIGF